MAQVINTNIASLNAQRNLSANQSMLQTSLQRLSSGLRINSAADDAAGLAISSRMTTQINGLNQAARNANDGISLSQTGDGALAEITNNLQRIRELAVQATNSTNSASDRATLNQEVQQRLAEIDRMASQTSFNGQRILDGSFGSATFQVGANAGETISMALGASASVRTSDMGKIASTTSASTFAGIASNAFSETAQALAAGDYSKTTQASVDASVTIANGGLNFTSAAVNEGIKISPLSTVFGSATNATSSFNFTATDFSAVTSGLGHSGINLSETLTGGTGGTVNGTSLAGANFNFQGSNATFSVDGHAVTLTTNYAGATSYAALATDIQTQLNATAGSGTYSVSINDTGGAMTITNNFSTNAVTVTSTNAAAQAAGINNDTVGVAGGKGYVTSSTPMSNYDFSAAIAQFNVTTATQTIGVTLTTNVANAAGLVSAVQTQLDAVTGGHAGTTGYTVSMNHGSLMIVNNAAGGAAVNIANADANANTKGITSTAGNAGVATTHTSFTVGGHIINLQTNETSAASLATNLQTQLRVYDPSYSVTNPSGTTVTIQRNGSSLAGDVKIAGTDATAHAAGITDNNGTAGVATAGATFTIDGTQNVNLTGISGMSALVTALTNQLGGGYSVTNNNDGSLTIGKVGVNAGTGLVITNADAQATSSGFGNTGNGATSTNTNATFIAGAAAVTSSSFHIDSQLVSLNSNYASYSALALAIGNQATMTGYTVVGDDVNHTIKVSKNGSTGAGLAVDTSGSATGLAKSKYDAGGNVTLGNGQAATVSTAVSFLVDNNLVTLNKNYSGDASISTRLVADVQSQLDGYGAGKYVVSNDAGKLKITTGASNTAPLVSPAITNSTLAFTSTAGTANGSITVNGDLTINGVAINNGTYTGDQLAAQINSQVSGVYATFASNALSLISSSSITLAGAQVANTGLTAGTVTANSSKLASVDVTTTANANTALMQIDSALTTVNSLRGTFGAMQNRFTSAISSLQTASENITSARSRIQDTDFAAETASMTRSQILQQAGTAMLAQANALPNSVLALLK